MMGQSGAVRQLTERNQPVLPAFFPIAVTIRKRDADDPVPLLIYRSFKGIHAQSLKTGQELWKTESELSFDRLLKDNSKSRMAESEMIQSYLQGGKPQVLIENSTLGTLSTDGNYVYAVEDLAVTPPSLAYQQLDARPVWNGPRGVGVTAGAWGKDITDAFECNKLYAYDLARDGAAAWQIGGKSDRTEDGGKRKDAETLKNSYFLGPPLPLGGKCYVLLEKSQQLHLVCLDPSKYPSKGENPVVWMQLLATTQNRLYNEPNRRMQAAQLSYGEGILVCPTNAGAVLGVDLMSHSLVWAHPYREKTQATADYTEMMMIRRGFGVQPMIVQQTSMASASEWKVSAPVIQEGKVVFTAPDANAVHCLNMRDGSLLWKVGKAEEDLYMGGVFNGKVLIVGKKMCRALSLKDGSVAWSVDTGMPSGQGIASDNVYYLPLRRRQDQGA